MIVHLIKCEMCENQFQFNHFERPHERKAPDSWFTVFQSKDIQAQEGWHFCSLRCLNRWVLMKAPLRPGHEAEDCPHEPYPYCCSVHYPLPERNKP